MHRLTVQKTKAGAGGRPARYDELSSTHYRPHRGSSRSIFKNFLPRYRRVGTKPANRVNDVRKAMYMSMDEKQTVEEREKQIAKLIETSTEKYKQAIQRGRKAGQELRRDAEKL
ncbi:MAG: hypothetical protein CEE38_17300 [Planctomycetes bacterium B3_Pla]|nr:MAG: hypothetical protein CEE38_17300 [Planctomycetes bacterium B3_Pla]